MERTSFKYKQVESVVMDIERHLNNRPLTYVESESGEEQVLTPNLKMWGQNAHVVEDREMDGDGVTRLQVRLPEKRQHEWQQWTREYICSLIESHRIKRSAPNFPKVGEVVLIVGEEKKRREWKKGLVLRNIKGRDGVVRGVVLRHKGHTTERPLSLVCPLKIKGPAVIDVTPLFERQELRRSTRRAAQDTRVRMQLLSQDEE